MTGHRNHFLLAAAYTLSCNLLAGAQVTLPESRGKTEFVHNCVGVCHRAEMVVAARKTPEDWRKSVDDMAARGSDGTKEDLDNVVFYLVTNYSLANSAPGQPSPAAPPSSPRVSERRPPSALDRSSVLVSFLLSRPVPSLR